MIEPKKECCPLTLEAVLAAIKSDPDCINEIASAIFDDAENVEAISTAISENANSMEDIKQGLTECLNDPELPGAADLISAMRNQVTPATERVFLTNTANNNDPAEVEDVAFTYERKFASSVVSVQVFYTVAWSEAAQIGGMSVATRLRADNITGSLLDNRVHSVSASAVAEFDSASLSAVNDGTDATLAFSFASEALSGTEARRFLNINYLVVEYPN